jgi:pimeloyl-ACP methyl ester carboxylesterase
MDLLSGVRAGLISTDRLETFVYESGPEDGIPVVMIHGNLSTGRFYEHLWPSAPDRYRFIAPDMRSFGRSAPKPIDATGGLQDWADDTHALVGELGIQRPVHLVGWSTGGSAIAAYATDREVASLTMIDPVSPYGYGATHRSGTPCYPDWAGSGGGTGNPDFTARLSAGDRSTEDMVSPRNVINSSYWAPTHREPSDREEILVDEVLLSVTGDDGYPGDFTVSENWPTVAPGTRGILNALSGKYSDWSNIVDIDPKPPVLWTHGSADIVVADGSAWEMGTLGQAGLVPGWPGAEVFPPQPMVSQIRDVLGDYRAAGGRVTMEMFEGSGHAPHFDAAGAWSETFFDFLASVE